MTHWYQIHLQHEELLELNNSKQTKEQTKSRKVLGNAPTGEAGQAIRKETYSTQTQSEILVQMLTLTVISRTLISFHVFRFSIAEFNQIYLMGR